MNASTHPTQLDRAAEAVGDSVDEKAETGSMVGPGRSRTGAAPGSGRWSCAPRRWVGFVHADGDHQA
jgi:hypothetical protein